MELLPVKEGAIDERYLLSRYVGIVVQSAKGAITGPAAPYLLPTMITGDIMIGGEAIIETAEW